MLRRDARVFSTIFVNYNNNNSTAVGFCCFGVHMAIHAVLRTVSYVYEYEYSYRIIYFLSSPQMILLLLPHRFLCCIKSHIYSTCVRNIAITINRRTNMSTYKKYDEHSTLTGGMRVLVVVLLLAGCCCFNSVRASRM